MVSSDRPSGTPIWGMSEISTGRTSPAMALAMGVEM